MRKLKAKLAITGSLSVHGIAPGEKLCAASIYHIQLMPRNKKLTEPH